MTMRLSEKVQFIDELEEIIENEPETLAEQKNIETQTNSVPQIVKEC
jgi:hypothetical protein